MTKDKDLGSDAARTDPKVADRDRDELRKRAEKNIEQSNKRGTQDGEHPQKDTVKGQPGQSSHSAQDDDRTPVPQSTPGAEAAEPSPE